MDSERKDEDEDSDSDDIDLSAGDNLSEDYINDLQTFTHDEYLNESTADFNKEIRQIN